MDNLEPKAPAQPASTDWRDQFNALRHLIVSVMILLLIVSGTFNLYLWKQWRDVSRDLQGIRPQAAQLAQAVAGIQKTEVPAMQDFVKKMTEFGRTHPDFAPILAKYNIKPAGAAGAAPATATPLPAAPPKK
jgi:hypothetical protein